MALIVWAVTAVSKPASAPVAETGPIKVGFSMPLTGEAASFGEAGRGGAQVALKEINEAGGINGRKLEVIFEDDKCNKDGATVFNKLTSIDNVTAIVGPICSAAGAPGLPIAQQSGTPVLFFASAPNLTKTGDFVFRSYPSDSFQGKYAADFIRNELGKTKVAVLYVKNDWGQGLRDVFTKRFTELGGQIVYDEGVAQDSKDLKSQISKLKAANPELVYLPAYPSVAVIGLKQMKDLGVNVTVVGGDAFEAAEVFNSGVAEGVIFTVGKFGNPDEFKAKLKEFTDVDNFGGALVYDAVNVLAEVMREVGTDREAIRDALGKISYRKGISLPLIQFGPDHELTDAQFEIKIVKNGKPELFKK